MSELAFDPSLVISRRLALIKMGPGSFPQIGLTAAAEWLTDIFRREELDQIRWRLVIVTSEGIYREPLRTLERVRDALVACGAKGIRPDVQARLAVALPDPLTRAVLRLQTRVRQAPIALGSRLETANAGGLRPNSTRESS